MKGKVLVVEDHPVLRLTMRGALQSEGFQVQEAATLQATFEQLASFQPEVVVLDMGLDQHPDSVEDGLQVLEKLDTMPEAPEVIVVSGQEFRIHHMDRLYDVFKLMDKGDYSSAELIQSVEQAVAARRERAALTRRELEVLRLMCQSLTNKQIAGRLGIDLETVKTHVRSIYIKLEVTNGRVEACTQAKERKIL